MKLAEATWPDVEAFDREGVVLIPTGSLEQHGTHLPLITDTLLVTAVAEAVERNLTDRLLLTPTLWLGASAHHLKFAGTLTNSFQGYEEAIISAVESLIPHGFVKFFVLNGHGGNNDSNGISVRRLKAKYPDFTFGQASYYEYVADVVGQILEGPLKQIRHACEAETSLVMHLAPHLVRQDRLRNDGLRSDPAIRGLCLHFDEITEQGSFGYATLATPDKGKRIFDASVAEITSALKHLATGFVLTGLSSSE